MKMGYRHLGAVLLSCLLYTIPSRIILAARYRTYIHLQHLQVLWVLPWPIHVLIWWGLLTGFRSYRDLVCDAFLRNFSAH